MKHRPPSKCSATFGKALIINSFEPSSRHFRTEPLGWGWPMRRTQKDSTYHRIERSAHHQKTQLSPQSKTDIAC